MAKKELACLVNECLNLNSSDRKIKFYCFSDSDIPDVCLDNPESILKVRAIKIPDLSFPINLVWHAFYSLQYENGEPLQSSIEIPLEFLDRLRDGKDPEFLRLLIHYRDRNRLDVYVKEEDKH